MTHGISSRERPRELRWYHAAGLLFGDWGTSRLYVLGLAFVLSGHASFWYVAAMSLLVAVVGFSYTIICAHFPDGGGVYSAAKQRSPTLGVVGALLLTADYVITAALSAYAGFRYILPEDASSQDALYLAILSLVAIGVLNWFGPRRAGFLAVLVGVACAAFYLVIGVSALPSLGSTMVEAPAGSMPEQWSHFVNVILALSGVEAIANMTGIMAQPVAGNARRAIFAVLGEVVVLNLLMALAMNALPELASVNVQALDPAARDRLQDQMVRILAEEHLGQAFATVASVGFGLLLLSAANTAIGDLVSIQYLMGRDRELPRGFTRLNTFGMPWLGLCSAVAMPIAVLLWVGNDLARLAELYAIGVVGAITINLWACGTNRKLRLKTWEHVVLLGTGVVVGLVWITIAWEKTHALAFAGSILAAGLIARGFAGKAKEGLRVVTAAVATGMEATAGALRSTAALNKPRILVATRGGNPKLVKFAAEYARDRGGVLYVLFVREVSLAFKERGEVLAAEDMLIEKDPEAQRIFEQAEGFAEAAGVQMVRRYVVHDSPSEIILDEAAMLGADALLMGVSQRGALWRTLRGDMLQEVSRHLPEGIPLLLHA